MKKNILYWIKKLTIKQEKKTQQKIHPKQNESGTTPQFEKGTNDSYIGTAPTKERDYIQLLDEMSKELIKSVDNLVQVSVLIPNEHELHIYVFDNLVYHACINCNWTDLLRNNMYMEKNYTFNQYVIHDGAEYTGHPLSKVTPDMSISIRAKEDNTISDCAIIKDVENNGSIIEHEVELKAEKCLRNKNGRYNIGIGRNRKLDKGGIRFNHIAIDDNIESPSFNKNRYVSRSHAYITYENGNFVLYVEEGGTSIKGKRTTIFRNGQILKLDLPGMGMPLENNDQIVLSKSVILLFQLIK